MRVLKFGGTSLANAERFARAADIIVSNCGQCDCSAVLSAPAKITNALVAVVDGTIKHGEATVEVNLIEKIFTDLFNGLSELEPAFDSAPLFSKLERTLGQLRQYTHGMTLLGQCPDSIYARVISKGERLSIATMEALLVARGYNAFVIDPVKYLVSLGDYLEGVVDIDLSTKNFKKDPIPSAYRPDAGFYCCQQ